MARNVSVYGVNVDLLHEGDSVFLGDRMLNVLAVNREDRKVLCSGRKHRTKNFACFWVKEKKLGSRPRKYANRKFRNINALVESTGDGVVDWWPSKACRPTDCLPGSPGKIAELQARVCRGETLWSEHDADWSSVAIVYDDPTPDDTTVDLLRKLREWKR